MMKLVIVFFTLLFFLTLNSCNVVSTTKTTDKDSSDDVATSDEQDDDSTPVDDTLDTEVHAHIDEGINALPENSGQSFERKGVEAVLDNKETFKPGQTKFMTADPLMGAGGYRQDNRLGGPTTNSLAGGDMAADAPMTSPSMDKSASFGGMSGSADGLAEESGTPPSGRDGAVEEGDIYKVVGDRMYLLNTYKGFLIIDIANPEAPKVLSKLGVYGYPVEMYVKDNTVHALVSDSLKVAMDEKGEISFAKRRTSVIVAIDISNDQKPQLLAEQAIPGNLIEGKTRRVGDIVYTVSDTRDYYDWGWPWEVYITDGERKWESKVTIYSFNVANPEKIEQVGDLALIDYTAETFNDFQISATSNALMVAKNKWFYEDEGRIDYPETGIGGVTGVAVAMPSMGTGVAYDETGATDGGGESSEGDNMVDPDIYIDDQDSQKINPDYYYCYSSKSGQKTEINVIDISDENGAISVHATIELDGAIQDQFKQHYVQSGGKAWYFGLTVNQFNETTRTDNGCEYSEGTSNTVYSVDITDGKAPKVVGTLKIGKEWETVKASLFRGDKTLFAITSRNMDPLYAIDLGDPANLKERSNIDGLNGFVSVFRPIENGDFLIAVGTDTSGTCTGFEQGFQNSQIAVSIVDVRNLDKLALVDRKCLNIKGSSGSWSELTWNFDQAHKMIGIFDSTDLNLITVPANTWIEPGVDANYKYGHDAAIVGVMSWDLEPYKNGTTGTSDALTNRGSVVHPIGTVKRTTIYTDGSEQIGLNISDNYLSFINLVDLDNLALYSVLELAINNRDVFAFGDYLVKQIVNGEYYYGYFDNYGGQQQSNEFRIVKKGADADTGEALASFTTGPVSNVVQAGKMLLLFRNYYDEKFYPKPYPDYPVDELTYEQSQTILPLDQDDQAYYLSQSADQTIIHPYEGSDRTEVVVYDLSDPLKPKKRGTAVYNGTLPFYGSFISFQSSFENTLAGSQMGTTAANANQSSAGNTKAGSQTGTTVANAKYSICLGCGVDAFANTDYVKLADSLHFLISRWHYDEVYYGGSGKSSPPSIDYAGDADDATYPGVDVPVEEPRPEPNPTFKSQYADPGYYRPTEEQYYVLVSLDFADPEKPEFYESKRFDQNHFGLTAGEDNDSLYIHTRESAVDTVSSSDVSTKESLPYWMYYIRKIDVSDPAKPVLGEKINIPGTLNKVYKEGEKIRLLTTWYQYYSFTSKVDFMAMEYYTQRSIHLLDLDEDNSVATLLSSFLLNDWYINDMEITADNQIFLITQVPGYLLRYHVGDEFMSKSYEHLTILKVSEDKIVSLFNDDIKTVGAQIMTVAEKNMFINLNGLGVVAVDVSKLKEPKPKKFFRTMGWINSIEVDPSFAYMPASYYGLYTFEHTSSVSMEQLANN